MDRLNEMFEEQIKLQHALGHDPRVMTVEERIEFIKDMVLACTDELHEALNETGWKSWAASKHINEEAAFGELRDALQFLMNAMYAVDCTTPEGVAQRVFDDHAEKLTKNWQRIVNGYDGIAGKCPQCRRDLSETTTREVIAGSTQRVDIHCACGRYLASRAV